MTANEEEGAACRKFRLGLVKIVRNGVAARCHSLSQLDVIARRGFLSL
jgi:hypothetical protein